MSIGFSFSAKTRSKETMVRVAGEVSKALSHEIAIYETNLQITLCPMGALQLFWKREGGLRGGWRVTGECRSTPAGAGLHRAALELLDRLCATVLKDCRVEDETGYDQHRDFERMRQEHFYPWLKTLIQICMEKENEDYANLCLCWDMEEYQPEDISGTVITPLGRFQVSYLADCLKQGMLSRVADRFFLWDRPEKDALYHRNKALHLLWENCYFAPSERSTEDRQCNKTILASLERAAWMDPSLPLPLDSYQEVCALHGHKNSLPAGLFRMEESFPIGFRKGEVTQSLGELRFFLPGRYRCEPEENGTLVYSDNSDKDPIWRLQGLRLKEGETAGFSDFMERENDLTDWELENGKARWGWSPTEEEGGSLFMLYCQVLCGPSLYFLSVAHATQAEREEIISRLKRLKLVVRQEEKQIRYPSQDEE